MNELYIYIQNWIYYYYHHQIIYLSLYYNLFFSASFLTKTVPSGNELHKFLIWDTAGQERVSSFWFSFIFLEIGAEVYESFKGTVHFFLKIC